MLLPPSSVPGSHGQLDKNCPDLLSFAFDSNVVSEDTTDIYIDAEDPTRTLNAIQTRILVRKLIAGLKSAGLKQGDVVLVVLANTFLYSAIYFSIIGAGGVYVGANPASQVLELDHILTLCEPKFIITSTQVLPNIVQTSKAQSVSTDNLFVLNAKTFPLSTASRLPASPPLSIRDEASQQESFSYTDFINLTQHGESDWIRFNDETTARSTPAAMFTTSGTSGLPKAAISSHYSLVCQHLSMEVVPSYEIKKLISLPLFHVFAALFAHVHPIRLRQPLYVLPRWQLDQYVTAIHDFHITDTVMAPPIIHALNRSSLPISELLASIHWVGVGGAPIGAEAMQQFRNTLQTSATLSQVWGMTEIGVAMLLQYPEQNCDGSIGRPLPGYETRLVDGFGGTIVADHEPGELHIRYDGMMAGYKDQSPCERGGWFATGDLMTQVDGKFYVVGRSKELIKVNGWQVPPAELEAVLLTHPCISDVGVIGCLNESGDTEVPRSYVVRKTDSDGRCSTVTAREIYDYSRARLASYKALDGGVFFIDFIPRTASGKIQRFKLAQMDQYRRSVTDVLVQNNTIVAQQKRANIFDLKALAEEKRTGTRRSSRAAASQSRQEVSPNASTRQKVVKPTAPKRRSRSSLVDKMKALEATRLVQNMLGDRTIS